MMPVTPYASPQAAPIRIPPWWIVAVICLVALIVTSSCGLSDSRAEADAVVAGQERPREDDASDAAYEPQFRRFDGAIVTDLSYGGAGLDRWIAEVPGIAEVRIPSSVDDYQQPALWLAHDWDEPRPLLVVLHSWSVDYQQHLGIPYARWADENGWAMIHPDFRGELDNPDATGSDRAVQDVIDAVAFAEEHAAIDAERIFVSGFSGGGMMSLMMAGRHPDRFAGVVAWVPIHDLGAWHAFQPSAEYAHEIEQSCGGDPTTDPVADDECARRSPSAYLDAARDAGVPVYLGHGLADHIVPVTHSAWAFNQLADPDDRFDEATVAAIEAGDVPDWLLGDIATDTFFAEPDPTVLFARRSAQVTLVVFDGGHEGVYNPGLEWMVRQIEDAGGAG